MNWSGEHAELVVRWRNRELDREEYIEFTAYQDDVSDLFGVLENYVTAVSAESISYLLIHIEPSISKSP